MMKVLILFTALVAVSSAGCEFKTVPFSKPVQADVSFSVQEVERYLVTLPCGNVWFKLFLIGVGHIELFSQTSGNIFCKEAGAQNWYGGERTDFTMDGMTCDGDNIILSIERSTSAVTIKNAGNVLYTQSFGENDARCSDTQAAQVKTQVWTDGAELELSVSTGSCWMGSLLNLGNTVASVCGAWTSPFSLSAPANVEYPMQAVERYVVELPCDDVWFKLFLIGVGHIELFSRTRGNIFCKEAGAQNWYGGQKTDFTMPGMTCDGDNIILSIERSTSAVTIKNAGNVLYTQNFGENDARCSDTIATQVKTQVWNYENDLQLAVLDNGDDSVPFSLAERAQVPVPDRAIEQYVVKLPCDGVWFKLFLVGVGHIEIFSKTSGNIFCKEAGAQNWYGGQKTDFTMDGMTCDGDDIYLLIERSTSGVTIKNAGNVLYTQSFGENDARCSDTRSTEVTTQVWNYEGNLYLTVLNENSSCWN